MKKITFTFIFIMITAAYLHAQRREPQTSLVFHSGVNYFTGDLGFSGIKTVGYTNQIGYRYKYAGRKKEFLKYFSQQIKLGHTKLYGNDAFSNNTYKLNRNLHFKSNVLELSLFTEYYFIPEKARPRYAFSSLKGTRNISSYVLFGGGFFYYNPKAKYENEWYSLRKLHTEGQKEQYSNFALSFSVGLGAKYEIDRQWAIGLEIINNYTNTNYIDDVAGSYYDINTITEDYGSVAVSLSDRRLDNTTDEMRGHQNINDSYFCALFTVHYKLSSGGKRSNPTLPSSFTEESNNENKENKKDKILNDTSSFNTILPPIIFIDKIEVSEAVLRAGEKINVSITVNNIGLGEAKGVYAKLSTNMDYAVSYKKETKFKIINKTNGTATITIPITAKQNIVSSQLQVDIQVIEPVFGMEITGKRLLVATEKLKTPELILSRFTPKEIISRSPNNQIDVNEQIGFDFYIQNVGEGIAESVKVEISNSQTGVMFLGYSKQNGNPSNTVPEFNNIGSGKYELVTAEFFINSSFTDSEIKLKIKVSEAKGKYGYTESKSTAVNSTLTDDGEIVIIKPSQTTTNNGTIIIEDLPEMSNDLISNLPQNPTNKNRYALIIGNENYNQLIAVDYALNDSRAFKIYAEKVLGVPADHIIYKENVGIADFNTLITKASNLMNSNRELYVYYSGHGFPTKNGETYLMPVDVNEDNVSQFGIKLFDFYETLGKNNPAKVTVFIDACFSGGGRNGLAIARSGIKIKPKDTDLNNNIVSFTASTGDEVAQKYDNQQHGLFTYYLLNILKESKGNITYSQLATKLQSEVNDRSNIEKNLKEQNPKISIGSGAKNWENWRVGN